MVAKKFKIQLKNYSRIRVLGSVTVHKTLSRIVKKNNHRIGDFDSMKKVEYTKKRNPKSIFFEWRIRKISNRISEIIRIFEKKGQITKIATTLLDILFCSVNTYPYPPCSIYRQLELHILLIGRHQRSALQLSS